MDKIAVLIPCYNESKTIKKVIEDFKKALPESTIYVYDNNSKDDTAKIARACGAIVRNETAQGKGNVIRSMFREIDAECYIMVDGDDTYPAEHARELTDKVLIDGYDMSIGDRLSSTYFTENKRLFHNTGNMVVRKLINILFNSNIKDIMTGYRAFNYKFAKTFPVLCDGFEIETEMTIHALDKKMKTVNVIVSYRDRPEGSVSKLSTFRDGFKVMKTIMRLYKDYKPFQFFSFIAGVLIILSLSMFIPIFIDFTATGLVLKIPTLFACGVFAIMAVQSFFGGLILDTIIQKNKQSFEVLLNDVQHRYNTLIKYFNE